jgi:predicted ATP-grasp superfamily ATP-dependent carboligase
MRVFVQELLVAFWREARVALGSAADSLLAEGTAMAAAVASDLAAAGHDVTGFRDADLGNLPPPLDRFRPIAGLDEAWKFAHAPQQADYTLLIAPETRGLLSTQAQTVEMAGGTLLGPVPEFIRWASDKHATAATMAKAGVPVPRGVRLDDGNEDEEVAADAWPDDFPSPAVLKPIDGCGSQSVRLIDDMRRDPRAELRRELSLAGPPLAWRLEEFVRGMAISVAVLRGPNGDYALPPCAQHLAEDGTFAYQGGSCPLETQLAERARKLANRAVRAMPPCRGYIGIDLVLGPARDGSQDYVIEVNPRLTTSYIGLRALSETNLAGAMIDVVEGREPNLSFRSGRVEFTADGRVTSR